YGEQARAWRRGARRAEARGLTARDRVDAGARPVAVGAGRQGLAIGGDGRAQMRDLDASGFDAPAELVSRGGGGGSELGARIEDDLERLRAVLASDGELDGVLARRQPEPFAGAALGGERRIAARVQIPDEAVGAAGRTQALRR